MFGFFCFFWFRGFMNNSYSYPIAFFFFKEVYNFYVIRIGVNNLVKLFVNFSSKTVALYWGKVCLQGKWPVNVKHVISQSKRCLNWTLSWNGDLVCQRWSQGQIGIAPQWWSLWALGIAQSTEPEEMPLLSADSECRKQWRFSRAIISPLTVCHHAVVQPIPL